MISINMVTAAISASTAVRSQRAVVPKVHTGNTNDKEQRKIKKMERLFKDLFSDENFIAIIKDHLLFCPELKLENNFTTIMSIFLNKKGIPSRREAPKGNRKRCDLLINEKIIVEAKYHFDGDIAYIRNYFKHRKENPAIEDENTEKDWLGSGRELFSELKAKSDYFLWFLCVRDPKHKDMKRCKYKSITNNFYKWTESSYETSEAVIRKTMPELNEFFRDYRDFDFFELPSISTDHTKLYTFLYRWKDAGNAYE